MFGHLHNISSSSRIHGKETLISQVCLSLKKISECIYNPIHFNLGNCDSISNVLQITGCLKYIVN